MSEELVSVIDIATQVGKYRQTIFKVMKRLRIEPQKSHGSQKSRGQRIAYVTQEEANIIIAEIQNAKKTEDGLSEPLVPEVGVFYVIQLEPQHDPGRFKLGFASNMSERFRQHRCSAPYAKILKTWPCRSLWEKTVIDCVSDGCQKLHTEVFHTDSINGVIEKCDSFFKLTPMITNKGSGTAKD